MLGLTRGVFFGGRKGHDPDLYHHHLTDTLWASVEVAETGMIGHPRMLPARLDGSNKSLSDNVHVGVVAMGVRRGNSTGGGHSTYQTGHR